jgi:hypothetical protein
MTMQRWMVAVAIVAVAIGAERTRRRWVTYRKKAAEFARLEQGMIQLASARDAEVVRRDREVEEVKKKAEAAKDFPNYQRNFERIVEAMARTTALMVDEAGYLQERADFYARLKQKYQRAARYPWLLVEPDPSEPRTIIDEP